MQHKALGIYRGKVLENYDPEVKGRVKVWVPGIYPESFMAAPKLLPWAEPVMPLFGGSFTNGRSGDLNPETGVTTIPHEGAELWVFFENGNLQRPKFFAACQGGDGWHSEHNNQHVVKTDNVRLRIDEEPTLPTHPRLPLSHHTVTIILKSEKKWRTYVEIMEDDVKGRLRKTRDVDYTIEETELLSKLDVDFYSDRDAAAEFKDMWDQYFVDEYAAGNILVTIPTDVIEEEVGTVDDPEPNDVSTCKFDTYNRNCTYTSRAKSKTGIPTRVDIEIMNPGLNALNLIIHGNVNLTVTGDVFEEIYGDKHQTLSGNLYQRHFGDTHLVQDGSIVIERTGRRYEKSIGDMTLTLDGNRKEFVTQEDRQTVLGDKRSTVRDVRVEETYGNKMETIAGQSSRNVAGAVMEMTLGEVTEFARAMKRIADFDITEIALSGNINEQAKCDIISIAQKGHIYAQAFCNIFEIALNGSIFEEALKNIFNIVRAGGMYTDAVCGICHVTDKCISDRGYEGVVHQALGPSGSVRDKAPFLFREGRFLVQDWVDPVGTIQHDLKAWTDDLICCYYDGITLTGGVCCVVQLDYPCSGCCWSEYSGFVSGGWRPDIEAFYYGTAEYFSTFMDLSAAELDTDACAYN